MMGTVVVSNLGKAYKNYPNRWLRLLDWISPGQSKRHELKWAVKNISFEVGPGEAMGIIGINGAGKSTLLKLIAGTAQPTQGSVQMKGHVAAMLELGMGFHPDFTGRQNVFTAGQLLNLPASEIVRLMPEITSFAEIGDYIDQPLRVYSSGMQVRLAFSLATAVRPDVLIVDEALSVGDAYFQQKSFARIREFRKLGTTLLLVSHDPLAILNICDKVILIEAGQLLMQGDPQAVMDYYNAKLADHQDQTIEQQVQEDGSVRTSSGTGQARVERASLMDSDGRIQQVIEVGGLVRLNVVALVLENLPELIAGFMIKDRLGQPVFGTNSFHCGQVVQDLVAGKFVEYDFEFFADIGPGHYSITIALHSQDTHLKDNYQWQDRAIMFEVVNTSKANFVGMAWLDPSLKVSA